MANEFDFSSLGIDPNNLPQEYGNQQMNSLDSMMQTQQNQQLKTLLDGTEETGLFRSGMTQQNVRDNILTPAIQNRNQSLLNMVGGALSQGRDERLQGVAFNRQKDMTQINFDNQMKELDAQASQQQNLLRLQAQLGIGMPHPQGFGGAFLNAFGQGAGQGIAKGIFE